MKSWHTILVLLVSVFSVSCASRPSTPRPLPVTSTPEPAYVSNGRGEPRTPSYWALWNSCAEENRAVIAAANDGREAGWFLMDDLLADPGIQLGDFPVATCEEGMTLLQGHTIIGEETDDPVYSLATALLAAELNLNAGAENCPIAEEAVVGGHLILSQVGFNGGGTYFSVTTSEIANAIPRLVDLLSGYNRGELCI